MRSRISNFLDITKSVILADLLWTDLTLLLGKWILVRSFVWITLKFEKIVSVEEELEERFNNIIARSYNSTQMHDGG